MTTIHIPETIDEAKERLIALGKLSAATEWERAALVYAYTTDEDKGGNRPTVSITTRLSARAFAGLGIYGLTTVGTVLRFRKAWAGALADGLATDLNPGDEVATPSVDFNDYAEKVKQRIHIAGLIDPELPTEKKLEVVRRIIESDSEVARRQEDAFVQQVTQTDTPLAKRVENAVIQKAAKDTALYGRVAHAWEEQHPTPLGPRQPVMALNSLGFGSAVYLAVQGKQELLGQLVDYLQLLVEREDGEVGNLAQEEIDGLEKAKALIDRYVDTVRQAIGVDYEATFNRLVGRG